MVAGGRQARARARYASRPCSHAVPGTKLAERSMASASSEQFGVPGQLGQWRETAEPIALGPALLGGGQALLQQAYGLRASIRVAAGEQVGGLHRAGRRAEPGMDRRRRLQRPATVGHRVIGATLQSGDPAEVGEVPGLIAAPSAAPSQRQRLLDTGARQVPPTSGERDHRALEDGPLQQDSVSGAAEQDLELGRQLVELGELPRVGVHRLEPVESQRQCVLVTRRTTRRDRALPEVERLDELQPVAREDRRAREQARPRPPSHRVAGRARVQPRVRHPG